MKKKVRRILAVCLVVVLALSVSTMASAASFTFNDGNGIKTMTVTVLSNRTRSVDVDAIPPMDHYQGITETMASMDGFSVSIYANYDHSSNYDSYIKQAMEEAFMLQSYTYDEPGPFYYTFDMMMESGLYQLKVRFGGRHGRWSLAEGTSAAGTLIESGTITYAPNGDASWFVDKIG